MLFRVVPAEQRATCFGAPVGLVVDVHDQRRVHRDLRPGRHKNPLAAHLINGKIQPHPFADRDRKRSGGVDCHASIDPAAIGHNGANPPAVGLYAGRPGAKVKPCIACSPGESLGHFMGGEPPVFGPVGGRFDFRRKPRPARQHLIAGQVFGVGDSDFMVSLNGGLNIGYLVFVGRQE